VPFLLLEFKKLVRYPEKDNDISPKSLKTNKISRFLISLSSVKNNEIPELGSSKCLHLPTLLPPAANLRCQRTARADMGHHNALGKLRYQLIALRGKPLRQSGCHTYAANHCHLPLC
jgi:hypothetical protein